MKFPVKIGFTKWHLEKRLNVHKYNNKECIALKDIKRLQKDETTHSFNYNDNKNLKYLKKKN